MGAEQNTNKICKHKAGDVWKDGCCGDDAIAKNNATEKAVASDELDASQEKRVPVVKHAI